MRINPTVAQATIALSAIFNGADAFKHRSVQRDTASQNRTADTEQLKTWWHTTGEINTKTPVRDENVRQSHLYSVQVSTASATDYYDSFVYESIPRSGKGKICFPNNYNDICDEYDGITIENDVGITMGWSQFLYGSDVNVKVTRPDGWPINSTDEVTIRPTTSNFEKSISEGSVIITVPYTPETNGVRFSVEFEDDVWEYRKGEAGVDYVQDTVPEKTGYVRTFTDSNPVVGREPKNSLLIFASPFPADDLVPVDSQEVYHAQPGWVSGLESIENKVVSFGPGVYHFTAEGMANLSSSVEWVYIAPGAYVKGAVQYNKPDVALKATGFGVLSGEMYVYQANPASGWNNNKSDASSLKMWRGESITVGQSWIMNGITTANLPFNAMDFYGATNDFKVDVSDYKQVGGFYAQTDGFQMYDGSHFRDVFYHTGDDTIKVYHSNVIASDILVWKTNNAPVIQFGWYPRNVSNVLIDNVNVIHSRFSTALTYAPRALIGSSSYYHDLDSTSTANLDTFISNITISNLRAEGISPALLGMNLLSNLDTFNIQNVYIEALAPQDTTLDVANVTGFTNEYNQKVSMGANSPDGLGLIIEGFHVSDQKISYLRANWNLDGIGKINVDPAYWGKWTIRDAPEDSGADDVESRAVRTVNHPRMLLGPSAVFAVGVGYLAAN